MSENVSALIYGYVCISLTWFLIGVAAGLIYLDSGRRNGARGLFLLAWAAPFWLLILMYAALCAIWTSLKVIFQSNESEKK